MSVKITLILGENAVARYHETGKIPSRPWLNTHGGEVINRTYRYPETFNAVAEVMQKMAGQQDGIAVRIHKIPDKTNSPKRTSFQRQQQELVRAVADELCSIPDYPEGLFPHTVHVEVEDENGEAAFKKYKLAGINQAKRTCLLESPDTGKQEEFMLTAIETEWLIEVLRYCRSLTPGNKAVDVLKNIPNAPASKLICPICRGIHVACDARVNPNTREILNFFDDMDGTCVKCGKVELVEPQ